MATKEEWREYFELVNQRPPKLEEYQAALRKGEIEGIAPSVPAASGPYLTTVPEFLEFLGQKGYSGNDLAVLPLEEKKAQMAWVNGFIGRFQRQPNGREFDYGKNSGLTEYLTLNEISKLSSQTRKIPQQLSRPLVNTREQIELWKFGRTIGLVTVLMTVIGAIVGFSLFGSMLSGIGSFFTQLVAAINSSSVARASFDSVGYQNRVNIIQNMTTVFVVFLIVGQLAWLWFTISQLKKKHYKGWAIYFLIVGIYGMVNNLHSLYQNISDYSRYSSFISSFGASQVYMAWGIFSNVVYAGISIAWISVFMKSKKIR